MAAVVVAVEWAVLGMAPAEQDQDSAWAAAGPAEAGRAAAERAEAGLEAAALAHLERAQVAVRVCGNPAAEAALAAVDWVAED